MSGDITIDGHELSAFFGWDGNRWAICECDARFEGLTVNEVVDFYEHHYAVLCLEPGVGKARAALAEALARKAVAS